MTITPSYTLKQIAEKFPNLSDSGLRLMLLKNHVKGWKPQPYEKEGYRGTGMFYEKRHIDFLVNPTLEKFVRNETADDIPANHYLERPIKPFDIIPTTYDINEYVTFYEGSYKWRGTVADITKEGYVVNSSEIGKVFKKWFELGK